jgi:hypothetical protein
MIPEKNKSTTEEELNPIPWASFLEKYPAGKMHPVKDVIEIDGPFFNIATPDIRLYCNHPSCTGEQTFKYSGLKLPVNIGKKGDYYLKYTCRICEVSQITLKVHLQISSLFGTNKAIKYGG